MTPPKKPVGRPPGSNRVKISITISLQAGAKFRAAAKKRGLKISHFADELFLNLPK